MSKQYIFAIRNPGQRGRETLRNFFIPLQNSALPHLIPQARSVLNLDFKSKIQALTGLGEMLSTAVFPVLQGGHTHIYTPFPSLWQSRKEGLTVPSPVELVTWPLLDPQEA